MKRKLYKVLYQEVLVREKNVPSTNIISLSKVGPKNNPGLICYGQKAQKQETKKKFEHIANKLPKKFAQLRWKGHNGFARRDKSKDVF